MLFKSPVIIILSINRNFMINKDAVTVNPDSSKEAKALLNFLYEIKGKYILSGHHNKITNPALYNKKVEEMIGDYPVIWGSDFSYSFGSKDPDYARQEMIATSKIIHKRGQIVTLMWHECFPSNGESCRRSSIWVWDKVVTQERWDSLTTQGTKLNNQWRAQADNVAKYLKQLRDLHIPVLWRPFHEMNGVWFWWCRHPGENGFAKLWKMIYDYFTNHHKLNNLLWVWNANAPRQILGDEAYDYRDYFPGIDYVDVLAADAYHNDYKQSHHDDLLKLAGGKPIALGEVGQMPAPEILIEQPEWTWFMGWSEFLTKANKTDSVKILYNSRRTLTLKEVKRNKDGSYKIILNN